MKRNIKYCTITGGRSARGGDVDPASAVGGVHISLLRELLVRYVPFAVDISLREVTPVKMRVDLLSYQTGHYIRLLNICVSSLAVMDPMKSPES